MKFIELGKMASTLLQVKMTTPQKEITKVLSLEKEKDMDLKPYQLDMNLLQKGDDYVLEISSNAYTKDLYLHSTKEIHFENNFFDLFPHQIYRVKIHAPTSLQLSDIMAMALNDLVK